MGKNLIIKGADFSENGFIVGYKHLAISNRWYYTTATNAGYKGIINNKRLSSTIDANTNDINNGILVKAGQSIVLRGLKGVNGQKAPLRIDFTYANTSTTLYKSNPSTIAPNVIGTASNYDAENYFPINTEGNDTVTIVNTYGADYYFVFSFAGPTKDETLNSADYNIEYYTKEAKWKDIVRYDDGYVIDIIPSEVQYGRVKEGASGGTNRQCSAPSPTMGNILVPAGHKLHVRGLCPSGKKALAVDMAYYTSAVLELYTNQESHPDNIVGTLSNGVAADFFPLNKAGDSNDFIFTNDLGTDYYFGLTIAPYDKSSTSIPKSDYHLMYYVE